MWILCSLSSNCLKLKRKAVGQVPCFILVLRACTCREVRKFYTNRSKTPPTWGTLTAKFLKA